MTAFIANLASRHLAKIAAVVTLASFGAGCGGGASGGQTEDEALTSGNPSSGEGDAGGPGRGLPDGASETGILRPTSPTMAPPADAATDASTATTLTPNTSAAELAELLTGSGVTITNATPLSADTRASGTFTNVSGLPRVSFCLPVWSRASCNRPPPLPPLPSRLRVTLSSRR